MEREAKIGVVNAYESAPKSKEDKFKNTIAFIKAAIAEGAHLKVPSYDNYKIIKQISEEEWVRQKNIIGVYFGSPAALEDIGIMYGIAKQRAAIIKNRGMRNIWANCSLKTQELFPFQELSLDKPRSQRSKERQSQSHGGKSIFIRDQTISGKSIQQIRKENAYSTNQVVRSRPILKGWGIEMPYIRTPHSQNVELERKLRAADTDKEKQELLNQVKLRFYQDHVKGENPLITALTNIVLEAGLGLSFQHQNVPIFTEYLKNVGFPMAEIHKKRTSRTGEEKIETYHFLLAKDKERAKQILLSDPNLQRFRRS